MRRLLLFVCLVATGACAARSGGRQTELAARAASLVEQGCYDCLLEARELYASVPPPSQRPLLVRMLEVELLLALREKELALEPSDSMRRASALAAQLAPAVDARPVIAIVDALAPDPAGSPREQRASGAALASREALGTAVDTIERSIFGRLFREYLSISLQCGRPPLDTQLSGPRSASGDVVPLLVYRRAACGSPIDAAALERVRSAEPRFVEAALFMGRAAMATVFGSGGGRVRTLFEEAYARFPTSPSVTFHLATVWQAVRDCRRAERYFTETLLLRDAHEDARLGRAICRTYLADAPGAIADATVLVDGAADNRAEALYWRAWNRRQGKELESARADIDASRALLYNARVLTLAGMIEYDQRDYDKSREDLRRARDMDNRECHARWYLGLIGFSNEAWPESAAGFAEAADCYAAAIAETEAQRAAMAARDDVTEEFRAQQLAGFDAAIAEDTTQKSAADLNAAINYARAGNVEQATVYMKRAAVDPERRTVVEDLRQVLGVPRW